MSFDVTLMLPELLVVLAGLVILVLDAFRSDADGHDSSGPRSYSWISAALCFTAAGYILITGTQG